MADFSLNLLCKNKIHLLPATLDSLKTQGGSFEIILLDGEGTGRLYALARRYESLPIRVENAEGCNLSQMMNMGLARSRGKYIQFLEPGDRYISQYGLPFLTELIGKEPEVIAARGDLQEISSHWLLRKKVVAMGGFDEHLVFRPMLDLLCRFEKEGVEPLWCGRVLVDSPQGGGGSIWETAKVLYRHFGLKHTFKWFLAGRSATLRRAASFFKEAFWRE
ncbi:MAG: glycosyltransferase [Chlamydiales bacterium]